MFSAVCAAALMAAGNALAYGGKLSPQDFNKMYYLAQNGKVGILREAVNRGLNIDAVNPNGDTGLCIAVKRKDHVAYNTFRMSGANPRHRCTYEMYNQYQEFLESGNAAHINRVVGNEESLYYKDDERSWWPWILGGAAVGGGIWALTSGGGSSSKKDKTIIEDNPGYGLTGFLDKYYKLVSAGEVTNTYNLNGANPNAEAVVDKIKFLPNMLDNKDYLRAYVKIIDGASYRNLDGGSILSGDAAVAMAAYGNGSKGLNDGALRIDARNGAIGMAASNGAEVLNNPSNATGKIDIIFKGGKEGDAVIGMYADTGSKAVNYGQINGTSSKTPVNPDSTNSDDFKDELTGDDEAEKVTSANSGAVLGMAVFDFYTGTNNSAKTVSAENHGDISLSAGYNSATDVSVNLVGMGSYIDDGFLNGVSNPAFAEQMKLDNYGTIALKYDGVYKVSDTALKLGDGGLIGMRADASTQALNRGTIDMALTSTEMSANADVAAGMLSVHGAEITNGTKGAAYNGAGSVTGGTIRITNEAQSGGVSYGMLAAKGDGTQTKLYQWKAPKVYNFGLVDMLTSNSYAMASFAGGEVVNNGVINLGYDKGGSFYKNDYGIYSAGGDDTASATLINNGLINVYATESTALYNAFAGAVTLENNGTIYLSNKATKSLAMGGNFSEAVNRGLIEYKVGNSENAGIGGVLDQPGFSTAVTMENAVVAVGDTVNKKQLFVNETAGEIIVGDDRQAGKDYGGTYVTAGIQVKNQGAASNKGLIRLVKYDKDTPQVNAAMWLDNTTSNEAYINNRGNIIIDATASIGMRNASQHGAEATNYGHILVNGDYSYGMSVVDATRIFNGREKNAIGDSTSLLPRTITVSGDGAAGMYIKDGIGYNYGSILVTGKNATAVIIDSTNNDYEHFFNYGDITFSGKEGQNYYWLANGSKKDFDYSGIIDKYTLAKVTSSSEGSFSGDVTITGKNAHLFVVEDGTVNNVGVVTVKDGATAIVAGGKDGSSVMHAGRLDIGDATSEATGIDAKGAGTNVTLNSEVTVHNGLGVYAGNGAVVTNYSDVMVNNGVGLLIEGVSSTGDGSEGRNEREIVANGAGSTGVKVFSLAKFENNGTIKALNGGLGVLSDTDWENAGAISVSGDDSVGVNVLKNKFVNSGTIDLKTDNAYAIYNQGGMVTNSGDISGIGTGVYNEAGTTINSSNIDISTGTGMVVTGGTVNNAGNINIRRGVGMIVDGTKAEGINTATINVTNGTGMEIDNGVGRNESTISVLSGYGMYVSGANAEGYNSGTITIEGAGVGAVVTSGKLTNTGKIVFNSDNGGQCTSGAVNQYGKCEDKKDALVVARAAVMVQDGQPVYAGENAKFINSGEVDFGAKDIDFDKLRDETGAFVLAEGGSYKADTLKGEVLAGKDIVMNGFADTYAGENAFEGKNGGLNVKSESYLFEANAKDKGEATDVELNRKKFEEVVEEKDLAAFWESNYQLQHNEKMFNALKSAETAAEFDSAKEAESGENFYANLPRENMAVLRGLNAQEQNRILEDGLDGVHLGADYYRTGKDGQGSLSGYADNVYSPYIGFGDKLNRNWSIGGTLRAAYVDAEYDKAKSSRDNKILLATLPVLYQNGGFKFLTTPSVGVGFGSYKRRALSGSYEADTADFYYGMYNHAEYSVDMKVAELVAEAELNLQGSSMGKAEEDDGLNLHSGHSLSIESGVGLKLRKRFALAKERSLMLAVGVKYYHEFSDPYKDLTVGMDGSPLNYKVNAYKEDKDRLRTTAEAVYKDGDFSVAAEIAHNAEKEANVEGGVGVRYNF